MGFVKSTIIMEKQAIVNSIAVLNGTINVLNMVGDKISIEKVTAKVLELIAQL